MNRLPNCSPKRDCSKSSTCKRYFHSMLWPPLPVQERCRQIRSIEAKWLLKRKEELLTWKPAANYTWKRLSVRQVYEECARRGFQSQMSEIKINELDLAANNCNYCEFGQKRERERMFHVSSPLRRFVQFERLKRRARIWANKHLLCPFHPQKASRYHSGVILER